MNRDVVGSANLRSSLCVDRQLEERVRIVAKRKIAARGLLLAPHGTRPQGGIKTPEADNQLGCVQQLNLQR